MHRETNQNNKITPAHQDSHDHALYLVILSVANPY